MRSVKPNSGLSASAPALVPKLKHGVWMALGSHPTGLPLFRLYKLISRKGAGMGVVCKDTEIVIEGYPRCANTFSIAAFILAQARPVVIAHHLHAPAQIIWAARKGIPALVLIREPVDAVVSLLIRQPNVSLRQALRNYIRFYSRVLPFRDDYVIATFGEVTSNFGEVIKKTNARFGTTFAVFEATKENMQKCYDLIDEMDRRDTGYETVAAATVARPSQDRERLKIHLKERLEEAPLQELIAQAKVIYQEMTENTV